MGRVDIPVAQHDSSAFSFFARRQCYVVLKHPGQIRIMLAWCSQTAATTCHLASLERRVDRTTTR
ncbi:MAG: hypothetical protein CMH35_00155 [Microbacterium sp.]|nr:hypothetical protein [Microbacterium sp.]